MLKFRDVDRDNCRIYFRTEEGQLYCWQDETTFGRIDFRFYRCTNDGEPSHSVDVPGGATPDFPAFNPLGAKLYNHLFARKAA